MLILNQRKYTLDLLKKTEKLRCCPISAPIVANHKISLKDGNKLIKEENGRY